LLNEKILEIITAQFRAGQVGVADVLQQKQLIEGNNGELIVLKVRLFNLEQRLAILLGVMPGSTSLPRPDDLVELPPLPATGLPVELLAKRPDIQSAYLSLLASDQRVAEAVANKFPTLSLSADVSTGGEQASDLFNNWISSLAANLVGPIFDGGFRQAEVDRSQAVASESFHRYGQTVLEAISEVETALILEQEQKQLIENLKIRLDLAETTVERVGDRYRQGAQDYQRVLTALLSFQGLQTELLRARQELIDFRIGLYRSLGGRIDLPEMTLAAGQISYGISDQEN
jgi:outer membrane protein TolC